MTAPRFHRFSFLGKRDAKTWQHNMPHDASALFCHGVNRMTNLWTGSPMLPISDCQREGVSYTDHSRLSALGKSSFIMMREPMLVVTLDAFSCSVNKSVVLCWPGPCVAVVLPRSGLSHRDVDALTDRCYVIELVERPDGAMAILAEVFATLGHLFESAEGPLVFVNRAAPMTEIDAIADAAAQAPYGIHAASDRLGKVVEMAIGQMLVSSPLLPEFFGLLAQRGVDDQMGLDLLRQTFGGLDS